MEDLQEVDYLILHHYHFLVVVQELVHQMEMPILLVEQEVQVMMEQLILVVVVELDLIQVNLPLQEEAQVGVE